MKIKQLSIASAIALGLFACNNAGQNETTESATEVQVEEASESKQVTYAIDIENSIVNFKGSMIGVYAHEGTLNLTSGTISMKNGIVTEGTFTVDVNSLITTDSDELYKMAPREKLVGHLKSDDFFGTEKFQTATFKVTNMEGDKITGELTLKGVTNEEMITGVKIEEENGKVIATGTLVFDRQKYGVAYKNTMNDMVLSDDIELTISLTGNM